MSTTEILKIHSLWLKGEKGGQMADLSGANLIGADLSDANLRGADLRMADLRSANLRSANLSSANLRMADLRMADLRGANLRGANLRRANLSRADLRMADLRSANLRGANLLTLHVGPYDIFVQPDYTCIGCERILSKQWLKFGPGDVAEFSKDARALWEIYGGIVKQAIRTVIAEAEKQA